MGRLCCVSDKPLLENLRAVVASTQIRPRGGGGSDGQSKGSRSASGSLFWADYIGAYPCDLVVGGPPRIRFRASSETKLGKENINLAIDVALPDALACDELARQDGCCGKKKYDTKAGPDPYL